MRRLAPADLAMRAARPSEGDSGAPISAAWLRNGIDAADGMKVLDRLLAAPAGAEVIVSSIPLDSLRAQIRPTQSARAAGNDGRALAPDDRPSGEVETELAQMWRDLLGVDTVGANDDFFELGGHSLIAVRLVNRVEKRFGARIKLATLFEARTVRHLAALLGGSREVSSYESLVAVQPSGTRPTLFVSHAVGGEVLSYSDLSRLLGPDQPFYAFRAVGHDGSRPFLTTIEEQAAFYVREMRMHQPEGPYYLAGYSHGGRVVFEMALQLRDAGAEVAFVGILDTWPHEGLPRGGAYALDWARNLPKWVAADWAVTSNSERWDAVKRGLRGLTRGIKMPRIAAAAVPAQRQIGDDMNLSGLPDHIRRTYENNFSAFLRYRPRFYEGPITLFRAEAQPLNSPHSRDLGWSRVARSVTVIDVPGNHGSLLQHPNVRDLARALREAMRPLGELPAERSGHQRGTEPVEIHVGNP
jgi:thioesterase domain-containing protein/acyl carrier protein